MTLRVFGTTRPMWLIPVMYMVVAAVLGLLLPRWEYALGIQFAIPISVSAAEAYLSSVTSGMMALTGIIFSIGVVIVQFSSSAYSPRLALILARDPVLFRALGAFVSTFVFALATLGWVDRSGSNTVPSLSIVIVGILLAVSMIYLARVILRLGRLSINNVLRFVGDQGRHVIEAEYPQLVVEPQGGVIESPLRKAPVTQIVRYHGPPLSLAGIDVDPLVRQSQELGGLVILYVAVGDTLVDGCVLLHVYGGNIQLSEAQLMKSIHLAPERTFTQDPKFSFRLLVDVAIRALSPAVNDPTTAVQALDQIEDLLSRLGQRTLSTGQICDAQGTLRLVYPTPTWGDFLSLAFDEIRQYGAGSLQVMRRLRSALTNLEDCAIGDARKKAVHDYLEHLNANVAISTFDAVDRTSALLEDRQGLGVSRS